MKKSRAYREARGAFVVHMMKLHLSGERPIDFMCNQRCPWTYVEILTFDSDVHPSFLHVGRASFGFAKANWPDEWDAEVGIRVAMRRALSAAYDKIVESQGRELIAFLLDGKVIGYG